jgi:hypothetical protein
MAVLGIAWGRIGGVNIWRSAVQTMAIAGAAALAGVLIGRLVTIDLTPVRPAHSVLRALHSLLIRGSEEHPIWVCEREGMDATTTLLRLEAAARSTAPTSPVLHVIPVDSRDVRLEQDAMTGSSLPTVVIGAG